MGINGRLDLQMDKFSILNITKGSWAAELIVAQTDLNDAELVKILRKAKGEVSSLSNIPVSDLRYKDLVKRRSGADATKISMVITADTAEKRDPVLKYISLRSGQGIEYADMVLTLSLFPLNKKGDKTGLDDVLGVLEQDNIPPQSIDMAALENALKTLHTDNKPLKDLVLTRGKFPEKSGDAEIKYRIDIKKIDQSNYTCAEKVDVHQVMLLKQPAVPGALPGFNVRGELIQPEIPEDIEMIAGENVIVSENGLEFVSAVRGIVRVRVTPAFKDGFKSNLLVSVEAVEVIDGSEPIRITIDRPIEIVGNLKAGSKIISQREVIISGDIEENTSIQTAGSILIEGNISGTSLSSEQDIKVANVRSSVLMAEGKLVVKGTAYNSELTGHEVYINEVAGCNVTAGKKIEIGLIRSNEDGFTAKLTAGLVSHLEEIIRENEKFIVFADTNLDKLLRVFGEEIVESAGPANISQMMTMHAENLRKMGFRITSGEQNEAIRQLIGTIAPIRELRNEKSESILDLENKKVEGFSTDPQIIIKQPVEHAVEIDIEGIRDTVFPKDGGRLLELKDNKIVRTPVRT